MPLLSSSRKAEQFARLLEGNGGAAGGSGSEMQTLQQLASRLSTVPQPRPEFANALRQQLMSQAIATLPAAAGAPAAAGGAAGSGGAGSGGAGGTASGTSAGGSTATGTSAATTSAATTTASTAASTAATTATAAGSAGGSALSAILSATAPVWAQFAAITAATAVAISGVGLGASQSLPGDPLYGVKRQIETIQLELAGGKTDSALAHLGFARTRLTELSDLLGDRAAGAPLSAALQRRVAELLADWASETTNGTTVLLAQLKVNTGDLTAVRQELTGFTDAQARKLAQIVQKLPDSTLQSYTGSAFAYLQRVDNALGDPVHLATLLPSLGLDLPTANTPTATPSTPSGKAGTPTTTPTTGPTPRNTPTSVPTLPIPTNGTSTPRSTIPTVPSVPKVPTNGPLGPVVDNTVDGANKTVNGVLNGVTGNGPGLKLPTSVPTVPGVSR